MMHDPWIFAGICFCVSMLVICALVYGWSWMNRRTFWRLVSWHPPRVARVQRRRRRWPKYGDQHFSFYRDLRRAHFPEDLN